MLIKAIHNDNDYHKALARIEELMGAEAGSPEGDLLDVLTILVEAYERKAFPMENPDPIEVIKFYMEQNGLGARDLQPLIGKSDVVHEVLNRKRPLTLKMIRKINAKFGISADILIREFKILQEA